LEGKNLKKKSQERPLPDGPSLALSTTGQINSGKDPPGYQDLAQSGELLERGKKMRAAKTRMRRRNASNSQHGAYQGAKARILSMWRGRKKVDLLDKA